MQDSELRGIAERILCKIALTHGTTTIYYDEAVDIIVNELKQLLDPSAGYTKVGETFSRRLTDRGFD